MKRFFWFSVLVFFVASVVFVADELLTTAEKLAVVDFVSENKLEILISSLLLFVLYKFSQPICTTHLVGQIRLMAKTLEDLNSTDERRAALIKNLRRLANEIEEQGLTPGSSREYRRYLRIYEDILGNDKKNTSRSRNEG